MISPHTGYGNDGIGLCEALLDAGADVYLDPAGVSGPLPERVALLLTKELKAPFDLLLHHADPPQLTITAGARRASAVTCAWTMWEFSTLDNCAGKSKIRKQLRGYDLVAGYDQVSVDALKPYVSTASTIVQGGFDPRRWPTVRRDFHADRFSFCMVGALHQRKNPFAAIEAFRQLKDEHPHEMGPVELHLKTVNPGLHTQMEKWIPGLKIHYAVWDEARMRQFYASQHVLLAPSRGEGKNMPALEMLSTGAPVIATNWGGHTQWLGDDWSYPLDYTLIPVDSRYPNCLWADADVEHLKQLMWECVSDRAEVARRARMASEVAQTMSWNSALDRLFTNLGEVAGERGAWLRHEWFDLRQSDIRELVHAQR